MTGVRTDRPWLAPLVAVLLALPFVPLFVLHPDAAFDLLTLLLVLGAGVRLGAAPADGTRWWAAAAGAALLVALALLTLFWSPLWLVGGLALLGAWSFAVARRRGPGAPPIPFGTVWPLAAALLVLWAGVLHRDAPDPSPGTRRPCPGRQSLGVPEVGRLAARGAHRLPRAAEQSGRHLLEST